jgi:hypothetical protein
MRGYRTVLHASGAEGAIPAPAQYLGGLLHHMAGLLLVRPHWPTYTDEPINYDFSVVAKVICLEIINGRRWGKRN